MRTLLCLLLLAVSVLAQGFDTWLPENTIFYMSFEDLGRSREAYERGPLAALMSDPKMQPFLEAPKAMWRQMMDKQKDEDGTSVEELWEFMHGQAALALVSAPGDEVPQGVMLVRLGEKEGEFRGWIQRMNARDEERGESRVREEEFQGITLSLHHSLKEGEEEELPTTHFLHDGAFVMAESPAAAKEVVTRIRAEDGSRLADNETFKSVRARTGARSDLLVYVDVAAAVRITAKTDEERASLDLVGFGTVKAFALQSTLRENGLLTRAFLLAPGEKTGILKILAGENTALHPPAFLPDKASGAFCWNVDFVSMWNDVIAMMTATGTGIEQMVLMQFQMVKQQTGVDIVQDVMGSFGKQTSVFFVPRGEGDEQEGEAFVVALQVSDRDKLKTAMGTLAGLNPNMQESEYLGVTIHDAGQLAYALLENHMIYAMGADAVRAVIRRYGKNLDTVSRSEAYKQAMAHMPEQRFMTWFSNPEWDRGPTMVGRMFWQGFMMGLGQRVPMDQIQKFIPDEKILRKYRAPVAMAMSNAEDGILFAHFLGMKKPEAEGAGDGGD